MVSPRGDPTARDSGDAVASPTPADRPPASVSNGQRLSHVEAAEEDTQLQVLRTLLRTFIALTALIALIALLIGAWRDAAISAAGCGVYAMLLWGIPRLGARRAGFLCTLWYFLLATGAIVAGRGIYDITMVLFPAGIVMGALLLKRSQLVPLIALTVVVVAGVGVGKFFHLLPQQNTPPHLAEVAVVSLLLLVTGTLTRLIVRGLQAMLGERRRAERALLASKQELEARNEALQLVNELAHRLHRSLDIDAIAREAVEVLIRHSHPPQVAVYLLDDGDTRLRMVADHGFTDEVRRLGVFLPLDGSLSGVAVREQRIVGSDDLGLDVRAHRPVGAALSALGAGAALSIPLAFGGRGIGCVNLIYGGSRSFSPLELDTFRAIGQAVSLAIANARHVAGLEHQAFHDSLTELPNRASLHRQFAGVLSSPEANGGGLGLVLLDLNRFREINDAVGHQVGDALLVRIGRRLAEVLAPYGAQIFRLGGDEFAVLVPAPGGVADVADLAHRLHGALQTPFEVAGMAIEVGASLGIAVYPVHGRDSHELLRCADVAMYHAKRKAVGMATYSPELDEHTPERLALVSELGRAIREGELVLHFQPRVHLASGAVVGFEALVRWSHPRLGLLAPAQFLPFAEASDLIHPLTYWVVEAALLQLHRWDAERSGLTMGINLSVRNLLDRGCASRLEKIIRSVGVDPSRVEFELTETAIMSDPEAAVTMLGRITSSGARLAIDDFGTGFSSLAHLTRFPVHVIKVDQSFVSGMTTGKQNLAIVRLTVHLARSLGLQVIAEGVEDRQTALVLRDMGCDMAQGFLFARPAPADEVGSRLAATGWQLDTAGPAPF